MDIMRLHAYDRGNDSTMRKSEKNMHADGCNGSRGVRCRLCFPISMLFEAVIIFFCEVIGRKMFTHKIYQKILILAPPIMGFQSNFRNLNSEFSFSRF